MTVHLAIESVAHDLPDGWRMAPFRRLAHERGVRNADLTERALSLSSNGKVYLRTEETDRQVASEHSERNGWVVRPGDLVVNPMWLLGGAIGVSDRSGAVSPDYRVYRLATELDPRYVHHLLRSSPYRAQYRLYMRAETTFDRRVTKDDFDHMPLVIPPIDVQREIASWLDRRADTTARALSAIEKRGRLLMGFLRGAIADAVEDNWPSIRLKHLAEVNVSSIAGDTVPPVFDYVDISAVDSWGRITPTEGITPETAPSRARRLANPGDIIISTVRTYLRAIAPVPEWPRPLVFSTGFAVLSPRHDVDPAYLRWAIQSDAFMDEVSARSVGLNYPSINVDDLMDIPIRLPSQDSQARVGVKLAFTSARLETLVRENDRLMHLMRLRQSALDGEILTGGKPLVEAAA